MKDVKKIEQGLMMEISLIRESHTKSHNENFPNNEDIDINPNELLTEIELNIEFSGMIHFLYS